MLKAIGTLGWSCGRVPASNFSQNYQSSQITTFVLDESFAISSVIYETPLEWLNEQHVCPELLKPAVCPEPFYPASPVTGLRVTGLSGQYIKENNVFAVRLNFTNAWSGGGVWKGCTIDGKGADGYSGGMELLRFLGFNTVSLVNTFMRGNRPILVYRYENICFSTAEIFNWE